MDDVDDIPMSSRSAVDVAPLGASKRRRTEVEVGPLQHCLFNIGDGTIVMIFNC